MAGYSRRENSSSAIRQSAYKENQVARGTGSVDMLEKPSRYNFEPTILKPNERHDGIALAPLAN